MFRALTLITLAAAFALASPAGARCAPPPETLVNVEAAADYLVEYADFIGFVYVLNEERHGDTLVPLLTLKGQLPGRVTLGARPPEAEGFFVVTSGSATLGEESGSIALAALTDRGEWMHVSECAGRILDSHEPEEAALVKAVIEHFAATP
jgi:hypothetical protein